MNKPLDPQNVISAKATVYTDDPRYLTAEQKKIATALGKKLLSAMLIELPYAYVEKDGKRFYTLSAKQGAVLVDLVVSTLIPK